MTDKPAQPAAKPPGVQPAPVTAAEPPLEDEQEQKACPAVARPVLDVPPSGRTVANVQREGRQIT